MTKRPFGSAVAVLTAVTAIVCIPSANAEDTPTAPAPAVKTATSPSHIDQYRNNSAHTGYIEAKLTPPLSLLWRRTTESIRGNPASAVYEKGIVYFGAGKHVYALNAEDGGILWQYPTGTDATASYRTTPALDDDALYIGNDDSQMVKLNAKTGAKIWVTQVDGPVRASPVVDSGVVYFGSEDQHFYALDADKGTKIWNFPAEGAVSTAGAIAAGMVIFGCADGSLYCLNSTTGRKVWQLHMNGDPGTSPPVYSDNSVFIGNGSELQSLTLRGGTVHWRRPLPSEATTPVTVGEGSAYIVSQDNQISAFTDRGRVRWTASVDYPSFAPPLLTSDALIVSTQHGVIYAFDPQTGALKWDYVVQPSSKTSDPKPDFTDIRSAPILVDNTLFVLSDDGTLSAFRGDAADTSPPRVLSFVPTPGERIGGARVPYSVLLVDDGSGIDPSTVTLKVDGAVVPDTKYDASKNSLIVKPSTDEDISITSALKDGVHEAVITASDWRGNKVTQSWGFQVDNRLNPAGVKVKPPDDTTPQTPIKRRPRRPITPGSRVTPTGPTRGGIGSQPPPPPPFPAQ